MAGCASTETAASAYHAPRFGVQGQAGSTRADAPDTPDTPDAPVSALPAPSAVDPFAKGQQLTIQRDCLVAVSVEEDASLNGTYAVNELGAIQFGYVGGVMLLNKTAQEAERKIKQVLESRTFKTATVKVEIQRASYDNVLVTGAVSQPGVIKIGAGDGITLNDALVRAGGVSLAVASARIRVVRGGRLSAVAPAMGGEVYKLVTDAGEPSVPGVQLRNNDVVYVFAENAPGMQADRNILVLGEVKRPGFYSFSGNERATVMNLVFKMGGLPPYANDKAMKIVRRDAKGGDVEIVVNARRMLESGDPDTDVPLEDGDRIIVPARRFSIF
jgi:polysaccharide export outer membrane protein